MLSKAGKACSVMPHMEKPLYKVQTITVLGEHRNVKITHINRIQNLSGVMLIIIGIIELETTTKIYISWTIEYKPLFVRFWEKDFEYDHKYQDQKRSVRAQITGVRGNCFHRFTLLCREQVQHLLKYLWGFLCICWGNNSGQWWGYMCSIAQWAKAPEQIEKTMSTHIQSFNLTHCHQETAGSH